MKYWLSPSIAAGLVLMVSMLAAAPRPGPRRPTKSAPNPQNAPPDEAREGEKRFRANCGRCHNPPESLSPREARAVVRHMRVRAMLTKEDERLILKYLAP